MAGPKFLYFGPKDIQTNVLIDNITCEISPVASHEQRTGNIQSQRSLTNILMECVKGKTNYIRQTGNLINMLLDIKYSTKYALLLRTDMVSATNMKTKSRCHTL